MAARWEIVEATGCPTARHEAAFVTFKDQIYLIGSRRVNPVDVFDPKTNTWTKKSEPPIELHLSYNNFIEAPKGPDAKNQMLIGVAGCRERWSFDDTKFFDVTLQKEKAIDHLAGEIGKSTADDPLYFLHMGPAEFFYLVVERVVSNGDIDSMEHVYIVSHSGYNDEHLRRDYHRTLPEAIKLSGES